MKQSKSLQKFYVDAAKHCAMQGYGVPTLSVLVLLALTLVSDPSLALPDADTVAELKVLTTETSKIVKNGCYIAGSASALVGAIWAVASQSLKVAASSAAITIVSLKAASFFATALLI
ncbi:MAG: hypothetical protein KA508_00375 [Gammaproteobacteria bacterium]|nr:hypothetical protein [Gammaproteobacteria bacterium]